MSTLKGKITSPGNYSDGTPRFEIGVYILETDTLPHSYHERITYNLRINQDLFLCGLNSTENSGCWIAPDIYDYHNTNKRRRLSEVLLAAGFNKNEEVHIDYVKERKELTIAKLS